MHSVHPNAQNVYIYIVLFHLLAIYALKDQYILHKDINILHR